MEQFCIYLDDPCYRNSTAVIFISNKTKFSGIFLFFSATLQSNVTSTLIYGVCKRVHERYKSVQKHHNRPPKEEEILDFREPEF